MNYDCAYNQVKDFVRDNSYDRYLIILMQAREVRPLLMLITAFHMEFQACCRYYQTPIVMSMRLRWWKDQLEKLIKDDITDHSLGHAVLVCLSKHVNDSTIEIKDLISCLEGFEKVFSDEVEAYSFEEKMSLIIKPYAYVWCKIIDKRFSLDSDSGAYKIVCRSMLYWVGYKVARGCNKDLEPYRYYFSDASLYDQRQDKTQEDKVIAVLEEEKFPSHIIHFNKKDFSKKEIYFVSFSFKKLGEYYKTLLYQRKNVRYGSLFFMGYIVKMRIQRIFMCFL